MTKYSDHDDSLFSLLSHNRRNQNNNIISDDERRIRATMIDVVDRDQEQEQMEDQENERQHDHYHNQPSQQQQQLFTAALLQQTHRPRRHRHLRPSSSRNNDTDRAQFLRSVLEDALSIVENPNESDNDSSS